jgi:TonB family protein
MNLVLWSLQATIVLAVAGLIAALARSAHPKARLALWQIALLATLLLPVIRPWQQEVATDLKLTHAAAPSPVPAAAPHSSAFVVPDLWQALALLLAAGIVVRLGLVAVGLIRLRKYRREAQRYMTDAVWHTEAELLLSDAVPGPVTFGFARPVVLLPTHFESLDTPLRETILYHEILHVRRRDWLFALAEETVKAVLWFHPAIWWTVREIQLTREEAVDREVVETMNAREAYVDALLAIAAAPAGRDMAPAPFFLRRKHLKHRVASIFREVNMSKTKSVSALLAGCCALALSCWYITGALPLQAQPAEVTDAEGVAVDVGGARLMHRTPVVYPAYAVGDRVQGTVVAQVRTDANGNVVDASIVSGPDELRKIVLTSVLAWHFAHDSANSTRQVSVTFTLPERFNTPPPAPQAVAATPAPATVRQGTPNLMLPIGSIKVVGLSDEQRDELLAKLPLRVGDSPTTPTLFETMKVVHAFDEHLTVVTSRREGENQQELRIGFPPAGAMAPPPPPPPPPPPNASGQALPPGTVRLGANVAAANLVNKVTPNYPELAKAAGVQGTVQFQIVIGTDGTVQKATLLSGPPLLVQAALQAVQQWVYKPTLLNGQPVPVVTTVDMNFSLAE